MTDGRLSNFVNQLEPTPDNELFDLIVAGFGPAALATAIALNDSLEQSNGSVFGNGRKPKVLFLEKQTSFAWHAGMLLPDASMQISFIKDMATLRNPLSKFTFLNYLRHHGRIVQFSKLNTFLPSREEFEDYLGWCASHFGNVVRYGEAVESITPETKSNGPSTEKTCFDHLKIQSRNVTTGEIITRRARHVVVAIGGYAELPQPFSLNPHSKVLHSSQYNYTVGKVLPDYNKDYRVAVIGGGQSAAEIFNDLHTRYPNSRTHLLFRGSALKPSDDSPFVNEIFDPDRISGFFDSASEMRTTIRANNRNTNYGVVRLDLLEHLYETMFLQRLNDTNENNWQHRLHPGSNIRQIDFSNPSKLDIDLEWTTTSNESKITKNTENFGFDLVVFATGYKHDGYKHLIEPLTQVFGPSEQWAKVSKDYRLLVPGHESHNAGVWLQGCNEETHGVSNCFHNIDPC